MLFQNQTQINKRRELGWFCDTVMDADLYENNGKLLLHVQLFPLFTFLQMFSLLLLNRVILTSSSCVFHDDGLELIFGLIRCMSIMSRTDPGSAINDPVTSAEIMWHDLLQSLSVIWSDLSIKPFVIVILILSLVCFREQKRYLYVVLRVVCLVACIINSGLKLEPTTVNVVNSHMY